MMENSVCDKKYTKKRKKYKHTMQSVELLEYDEGITF